MDASANSGLILNDVTVNLVAGTLRGANGLEIPLRAQSFAVLRELVRNHGSVVEKNALIDSVWKGVSVTDDSLVQCISEIRRAIGDSNRSLLKTVPRRGYLLDLPAKTAASPRSSRAWPVLLAGFVVLVLIAAMSLRQTRDAGLAEPPRISVRPFASLGTDRSVAGLGQGIAEDVVSILTRLPEVAVIASGSSLRRSGWGQGENSDYILDGSIRRSGDKLRIAVQLADARSGQGVWSGRFDRPLASLGALHDDVTQRIVSGLIGAEGALIRDQFQKAWGLSVAQLTDYGYYLRGQNRFLDASNAAQNDEAGRIWSEGLVRFPDSALLRSRLAWYHWAAHDRFPDREAAHHVAAAARLVADLLSTPELAPDVRQDVLWLNALLLSRNGRHDAAIAQAEDAVARFPYHDEMRVGLAGVLACAGDYDTALGWSNQAADRDPALADSAHDLRGWVYRLMGRHSEALSELRQLSQPSARMQLNAVIALVQLGRLGEAREWTLRALRQQPGLNAGAWSGRSCHRDPALVGAELASLERAGLPD